MPANESLENLRRFYLAFGQVGPLDRAQISVLPAAQKKEHYDVIKAIQPKALPSSLQSQAQRLREKLAGSKGSL